MKHISSITSFTLAVFFMAGCGSDTSQSDVPAAPNTINVENVNGNIPDTSNSITLNGTQRIDSSYVKDSLEKPKP